MSSGIVVAGTDGCTTMTSGTIIMPATGAMSRTKLKLKLVIECRVERVRRSGYKKRIAVRERTHDGLRGDITAGTRPVLDDELLAEPLRQPLTDETRGDVGATGGGIADNQAHRPRRISLRPSEARDGGRQRGSACGEMQKLAAGKFHSSPSAACDPMGRVRIE